MVWQDLVACSGSPLIQKPQTASLAQLTLLLCLPLPLAVRPSFIPVSHPSSSLSVGGKAPPALEANMSVESIFRHGP